MVVSAKIEGRSYQEIALEQGKSADAVRMQVNRAVERVAADTVKTLCQNSGNAYVYPVALQLTSSAGENIASRDSGGYILSGMKRSFDIKRDGAPIPGGNAKLVATLVDGTKQTFDVAIPQ